MSDVVNHEVGFPVPFCVNRLCVFVVFAIIWCLITLRACAQVTGAWFGAYSKDDILAISVKEIYNPVCLDAINQVIGPYFHVHV